MKQFCQGKKFNIGCWHWSLQGLDVAVLYTLSDQVIQLGSSRVDTAETI